MKIAVIAHNLKEAGGLSVGKNIIEVLLNYTDKHQFLFVCSESMEFSKLGEGQNVVVLKNKIKNLFFRIIWENTLLRLTIKKFDPDWVWNLGNYGYNWVSKKQSILLQDSHLVYDSKTHYREELLRYKLKKKVVKEHLKFSLKNIDRVYCQTPVVKARFCNKYGYPERKVGLCPNAVSISLKENSESLTKPDLFNDKKLFFFTLARCYGHKNLSGIVKLFQLYPKELSDVIFIITISEEQHPNAKKILKSIRCHGLEKSIINIGSVNQNILPTYFRNADALFLPTLLESFSSTYIEAMYFGTPIVTSDLDFAKYICGNAALYFNPWSTKDMLRAILKFRDNLELRRELKKRGKIQFKKFKAEWKDIVSRVLIEENIL
jgi:glycosyltransferase involved in cell wall biosynthesis